MKSHTVHRTVETRERREFVRTVEEFDRTFARIRRGLEDDLFLDRLEQVKQEQSLLAEHPLGESLHLGGIGQVTGKIHPGSIAGVGQRP